MVQLIIGSVLLSLIHAMIPNHWLPMVVIGKAEHWSRKEVIGVTALAGLAHAVSTILLGILIGLIGLELANQYQVIATVIAPLLLIFMGLVYFSMDMGKHRHDHLPGEIKVKNRSKAAIVLTLSVAMFFSPCLEIETYYFTAGTYGWIGITVISVIYLIVTISGMLLLVALGYKGIERFNLHFLGKHERKITGSILILLGLFSFYIH